MNEGTSPPVEMQKAVVKFYCDVLPELRSSGAMQVYRVRYNGKDGRTKGFDYFGGAVIARAAVIRAEQRGELAEITAYEVPLTRKGLLDALTQFGSHPDNR